MKLYNNKFEFASAIAKYTVDIDGLSVKINNLDSLRLALTLNTTSYIVFTVADISSKAHIYYDRTSVDEVALPEINYDAEFNMFEYVESCYELVRSFNRKHNFKIWSTSKLEDSVASWLKSYRQGYTFASFKEAVVRNIDCAFSYSIGDNLTEDCQIRDKRLLNTGFTYVQAINKVYFSMNFPHPLSNKVDEIKDLEAFLKLKDVDDFLADYASLVPEVAIYFRKKNIDNFLDNN